MRILTLIILTLLCQASTAEVFKCIGKYGAVSYQPSPCQAAIKQQQLEIKSDPAKDAEAKAKLDQVHSEYENRKSAQQEAEKLAAEQRNQAISLEAARRTALAQQEMAEAQRRQAEAMENQYNRYNRPIMIPPQGMPGTGINPGFNPGYNSGYNPP